MKNIFVNLKRFDIPRKLGGICLYEDPVKWTHDIIDNSIRLGLGMISNAKIVFLFPEAYLKYAKNRLSEYEHVKRSAITIGSQGVFREDVSQSGNFGAFTTNLPAVAALNLGAEWTIIGHSEERKDKLGVMTAYDDSINTLPLHLKKANKAVGSILNKELICAFNAGINVLLCVGETLEEKGEGEFDEQKSRISDVLREQLTTALLGAGKFLESRSLVIAYEPVWAIGPGKTPPGKEYISYVAKTVKKITKEIMGVECPVIYGGGLKEENAKMIAGIDSLNGGLVALTKFVGDIAFEPEGLYMILKKMVIMEEEI